MLNAYLYREAVAPRSPGLLQPWAARQNRFNRNAVASGVATKFAIAIRQRNPFRVEMSYPISPGLKQPWASGRNRFAVITTTSVK